jgi:hypothetical protein
MSLYSRCGAYSRLESRSHMNKTKP